MKATDIVRRIDDLGRVVIPKEIRRTLKIREGNSLEIYTDSQGNVIFKKYSPIGEMDEIAETYAQVINKMTGKAAFICDNEKVIAVSGAPKKEYLDKNISFALENLINKRDVFVYEKNSKSISAFENGEEEVFIMIPIIVSSETVGAVFSVCDGDWRETEMEKKLMQAAAFLLEKQLGF